MNKTETLLYIERLREGIRKLPEDAEIYGFDYCYHGDYKKKMASIHLMRPLEGVAAVPSTRYSGWHEMRLQLLPDVYAWWAETEESDGTT